MNTISSVDDGTLTIKDTKVTSVRCFQNTSSYDIRWSTKELVNGNAGGKLYPGDMIVLSTGKDVYFKSFREASIQCWGELP